MDLSRNSENVIALPVTLANKTQGLGLQYRLYWSPSKLLGRPVVY